MNKTDVKLYNEIIKSLLDNDRIRIINTDNKKYLANADCAILITQNNFTDLEKAKSIDAENLVSKHLVSATKNLNNLFENLSINEHNLYQFNSYEKLLLILGNCGLSFHKNKSINKICNLLDNMKFNFKDALINDQQNRLVLKLKIYNEIDLEIIIVLMRIDQK